MLNKKVKKWWKNQLEKNLTKEVDKFKKEIAKMIVEIQRGAKG